MIDSITESAVNPCMTFTSTLTSKNQTTLPKGVVLALKVKPSSKLSYEMLDDGTVKLSAKTATFADIMGSFPKKKPARPVTIDAMNRAVSAGAERRFKKAVK